MNTDNPCDCQYISFMTTEENEFYEILVCGQLDSHWGSWFEGLTLTPMENGETLIAGPVQDQAALHGILAKIRDLDLHLLAVVLSNPEPRKSKKSERQIGKK
jgi:hypothetical protein